MQFYHKESRWCGSPLLSVCLSTNNLYIFSSISENKRGPWWRAEKIQTSDQSHCHPSLSHTSCPFRTKTNTLKKIHLPGWACLPWQSWILSSIKSWIPAPLQFVKVLTVLLYPFSHECKASIKKSEVDNFWTNQLKEISSFHLLSLSNV